MQNEGLHSFRLKLEGNELEEKFAKVWDEMNKDFNTLEYLLAPVERINHPVEVSDRDRAVAATVIQWLGCNCGQYFLKVMIKRPSSTSLREK